MSAFLHESHRGSPTFTLLNVLGVLGVLIVINVLNLLNVLNVLNIPMDASLACWALLMISRTAAVRLTQSLGQSSNKSRT